MASERKFEGVECWVVVGVDDKTNPAVARLTEEGAKAAAVEWFRYELIEPFWNWEDLEARGCVTVPARIVPRDES